MIRLKACVARNFCKKFCSIEDLPVKKILLITLAAIILSGFFYPISSMPTFFQWLTLANPVRHFLTIVRSIFLKGTGIAELWPQYLTLLGMAFAGLSLAVHRFRRSVA